MEFLVLIDTRFIFLQGVMKRQVLILVITPQKGCRQFLTVFLNFDNICQVILKKKISFPSNCLSD